jgi:hypothetical protein
MNEPKRLAESGTSPAGQALLRNARLPRPPSDLERTRSFERVRKMAALPSPGRVGPWAIASAAAATVGVAAMVITAAGGTRRSSEPSATATAAPAVAHTVPPFVPALVVAIGAETTRPPPETVVADRRPPAAPATVTALQGRSTHTQPPSPPASAAVARSGGNGSVAEESIVAEARILERARGALAFDPSRTLEVCREHERQFPKGQLKEERELLELRALSQLGRYTLARERARALLQGSTFYAERARRIIDAMPADDRPP